MLSDEEKKAINELKEEINKPVEVPEDRFDTFILYNIESAKIVLNLIKKQSKEIEELKEDNNHQWEERCKLTFELENSTSNDKIKAKIEEVDIQLQKLKDGLTGRKTNFVNKNMLFAQKKALQSLLEKE